MTHQAVQDLLREMRNDTKGNEFTFQLIMENGDAEQRAEAWALALAHNARCAAQG